MWCAYLLAGNWIDEGEALIFGEGRAGTYIRGRDEVR